jgi:N-hydroxyarylamine O-acetyltransferase
MNLDAYLSRILYDGPRAPTRSVLEQLHRRHLSTIPFENLDVRLRRPVGLDLDSLEAKLVRKRRGGYCFEQNTLFAAVLRGLGFEVRTLEARVRPEAATAPLPRTHMTLEVEVEGAAWLADVGFGGDGPIEPVPLDGTVREQAGLAYRVARERDAVHVLQQRRQGAWRDLYAFARDPALPIDFAVAHHYTSTHPRSPFVNTLTVQRSIVGTRWILRGRTFTIRKGEQESVFEVPESDLHGLLRDPFGLDVPEEDVRRAVADGPPGDG